MLADLWDRILFRNFRLKRAGTRLLRSLQSQFADDLLEVLLKLMKLAFVIDTDFRRNIEDFHANYLFRTHGGAVAQAVLFRQGRMELRRGEIQNADVVVSFRDQKSLGNFLFSPKPDILDSILKQAVTVQGNLNYLYKFAFMANHLRLKAMAWS